MEGIMRSPQGARSREGGGGGGWCCCTRGGCPLCSPPSVSPLTSISGRLKSSATSRPPSSKQEPALCRSVTNTGTFKGVAVREAAADGGRAGAGVGGSRLGGPPAHVSVPLRRLPRTGRVFSVLGLS